MLRHRVTPGLRSNGLLGAERTLAGGGNNGSWQVSMRGARLSEDAARVVLWSELSLEGTEERGRNDFPLSSHKPALPAICHRDFFSNPSPNITTLHCSTAEDGDEVWSKGAMHN